MSTLLLPDTIAMIEALSQHGFDRRQSPNLPIDGHAILFANSTPIRSVCDDGMACTRGKPESCSAPSLKALPCSWSLRLMTLERCLAGKPPRPCICCEHGTRACEFKVEAFILFGVGTLTVTISANKPAMILFRSDAFGLTMEVWEEV